MSEIFQAAIENALEEDMSLERFERYLDWASGDRSNAFRLYALNTQISEALYTPLQMLEVILRNKIHHVLTETHHENWFDEKNVLLLHRQRIKIAKAREALIDLRKPVTSGRIVASLTLGFWTSMFNKEYETLWRKTLHRIAVRDDSRNLSRKHVASLVTRARILRNRIAHHEPVLHWNLPQHHAETLTLIGWMSPAAAEWTRHHSRFSDVYPPEGLFLEGRRFKPD